MWVAYVSGGQVLVRSAAGTSSPWSAPFLLAHGLAHDDIAAITARSGRVGVFWSNQKTGLFGYREHRDGTSLSSWTRDETPGARDAKKGGHGFADDHMKLVATPDGTLYVAAKTSYDSSARPRLILLVRRPSGRWDAPYAIDSRGTRPTIAVSANSRTLVYAYRDSDGGGPIQFRLLVDQDPDQHWRRAEPDHRPGSRCSGSVQRRLDCPHSVPGFRDVHRLRFVTAGDCRSQAR